VKFLYDPLSIVVDVCENKLLVFVKIVCLCVLFLFFMFYSLLSFFDVMFNGYVVGSVYVFSGMSLIRCMCFGVLCLFVLCLCVRFDF